MDYLKLWGPLATTNVAVTPIPDTFGQGFPGLIYLSTTSYLPENVRPPASRGPLLDMFYSDILLPHEIAHQWWGNLVVPSDYRSGWLAEALANYAAWELFAKERGLDEAGAVLRHFTAELKSATRNGAAMESAGPLDLGIRLRESDSADVWRVITYDKGTWVMRMLEQRMGQQAFQSFLKALAAEYGSKTLSNEEFRKTATRFLAKGDPDPTLELFFDVWVYGTGIPSISLSRDRPGRSDYTLLVSGTPAQYTVDIPVSVEVPGKPAERKWIRAGSGENSFVVQGPPSARVSLPTDLDFLYFTE
jgi:aminopeptidase N